MNNQRIKYDVDIVMCIDATSSMRPLLNLVKTQALNLYDDIKNKMERSTQAPKYIDNLRVRVVAFRDFVANGRDAISQSPFFLLPDEADGFEEFVRNVQPMGGGDLPEDGLEALVFAMRSQWNRRPGNKRRQIIVVWTDDATHDLGYGKRAADYPDGMPETFTDLTRMWGFAGHPGLVDNDAKRLLVYAPAKAHWTTIVDSWDNTLLMESKAGSGLDDLTYDEILSAIANSI